MRGRSQVESDDEQDADFRLPYSASRVYSSGYSVIPADEIERESLSASSFPQLEFVQSWWFQKFIGGIILLNVIVLWGETDAPDRPIWAICDNGFLTIFLFELVCRVAYLGWSFVYGGEKWWHLLDVCVVVLGVWDTWLIRLLGMDDDSTMSTTNMSVLRTFRLLRLLRLIRIAKIFNKVMTVVEGLSEVGYRFLWIFLALFFYIFCASIIMVKTLGEGIGIISEEGMEDEAMFLRTKFQNVPSSVFTLFQVATLDEWEVIADPIIKVNPMWRLFFIVFIAASWILVSVLTAVASNAMIAQTAEKREQQKKDQDRKKDKFIEFLKIAFVQADADGSGTMDKEEFTELTKKDYVVERMQELGVHLSEEDFQKAWDMLDVDGSGELSIDAFVNGFSALHEALATKHVVNIDYSLKRVQFEMEQRLETLDDQIKELRAQNEEMWTSLDNQERMREAQSLSLWLWQQWMSTAGSGSLTPDMADFDSISRASGRTLYSKHPSMYRSGTRNSSVIGDSNITAASTRKSEATSQNVDQKVS
mmetsp:Transcript_123775/g.194139  ORF Transcript_123775/g.194139 Transcript_123775/m.194139 type:complete len:534 (+) Transcript_123775:75-1676(+)